MLTYPINKIINRHSKGHLNFIYCKNKQKYSLLLEFNIGS